MLNYYEVMTTDLGLLTTAAGKWDEMATELGKVETRYGDSVQKLALRGESWNGISSGTAHVRFESTRYEYAAAQVQAKAIASLLREAHEKFTDLRKKLESARADAVAAGMTVSEQGHVAFDWGKLTPGERSAWHHDPDGQKTIGEAVAKWQHHIDDRVKAFDEVDQSVKTALGRAVTDSNKDFLSGGADESLNGFNAYASGDLATAGKPDKPEPEKKDDGITATGPDVGFKISGTKYGKEGSVKAYADLWHIAGAKDGTWGPLGLAGTFDVYYGARATANWGFSEKGVSAKVEGSVGLRALGELRAEHGLHSAYVRGEGFVGGEISGTAKVTKDEVTLGGKAFAGGKAGVAGGTEVGGIGVGLTAEGWAGPGAEAWWGYKKDEETGVYKLGGKAGASPILGGAIGLEITVDPHKVSKAAGDVADAVGDFADGVGDVAGSVKDNVTGWFD